MIKKFFKISFILLFFVLLSLGYLFYNYVKTPLSLKEDTLFQVKKNESINTVIRNLEENGFVRNSFFFKTLVTLKGRNKPILYGYYLIKKDDTPETLWEKLLKGEVERYKVTIPEGYNIYQIGEVIENQKMGSKKRFVSLAKDKNFIKKLGLDLPSLEGYLFPTTYFFDPATTEEEMIKEMVQQTFKVLKDIQENDEKNKNFNIHKVITLASLVEKEAKVKEEMPLIAAVFLNRLSKGMKLQCDPTVIYGKKNFDGNITKADLVTNTPYNTYVRYGLPPTPIANPSKNAILSVLKPAKVDYLYFVSKNDGTHVFNTNLKEHNKAVYIYQKKKKKKEAA